MYLKFKTGGAALVEATYPPKRSDEPNDAGVYQWSYSVKVLSENDGVSTGGKGKTTSLYLSEEEHRVLDYNEIGKGSIFKVWREDSGPFKFFDDKENPLAVGPTPLESGPPDLDSQSSPDMSEDSKRQASNYEEPAAPKEPRYFGGRYRAKAAYYAVRAAQAMAEKDDLIYVLETTLVNTMAISMDNARLTTQEYINDFKDSRAMLIKIGAVEPDELDETPPGEDEIFCPTCGKVITKQTMNQITGECFECAAPSSDSTSKDDDLPF